MWKMITISASPCQPDRTGEYKAAESFRNSSGEYRNAKTIREKETSGENNLKETENRKCEDSGPAREECERRSKAKLYAVLMTCLLDESN